MAKKKPRDVLSPEPIFEVLPVDLTSEQIAQRGQLLAACQVDIEKLKADKKDSAAEFKRKIEDLEAQAKKLSHAITAGTEEREVECDERLNLDEKIVEIVRRDTGEVVRKRRVEDEDLQPVLPETV